MKTQPTLYINRVTTVDCAILSQWGISLKDKLFAEAAGFSFNVDVELKGDLDPIENVVVDFGALKKFLKSEIDNIDYGYDHKLIVPKSLVELDGGHLQVNTTQDTIVFKNGGVEILSVPRNAVRITDTEELDSRLSQSVGFLEAIIYREYEQGGSFNPHGCSGVHEVLRALGTELKGFLQACVERQYPNQGIVVETVICDCETTKPNAYMFNTESPYIKRAVSNYFTYTHGLKKSTSMGCRNIVHGHLSYIQLVSKPLHMTQGAVTHMGTSVNDTHVQGLQELCNQMAADLNCTHFVHSENLVTVDGVTSDSYTAEGRGDFKATLNSNSEIQCPKSSGHSDCLFGNIVVLPTESTIENLVSYVAETYKKELDALQVSLIYISEGLHKGSYLHVERKSE